MAFLWCSVEKKIPLSINLTNMANLQLTSLFLKAMKCKMQNFGKFQSQISKFYMKVCSQVAKNGRLKVHQWGRGSDGNINPITLQNTKLSTDPGLFSVCITLSGIRGLLWALPTLLFSSLALNLHIATNMLYCPLGLLFLTRLSDQLAYQFILLDHFRQNGRRINFPSSGKFE